MINKNAIEAVFTGAMKLGDTESCLIVTDTIKEPIGRAFYDYARAFTRKAKIMVIEPATEHATEPPADVISKMMEYDVQLLITSKSLTHTRARIEACLKGARIATMPSITEDIANRCLDVDYEALRRSSRRVYNMLKDARKVRVTTALGMDMEFGVGPDKFFGKDGGILDYPGSYGNLPEGEIAFGPSSCEGAFIVDASFVDLGILGSPLRFSVKGGTVRKIEGERSAELKERLDRVGPKAYHVAELGIGLNPKATVIGNILEDEKVIGTVHVALGNDMSFGGSNDVPIHLDGVITAPSVYADGEPVMLDGVFVEGVLE